MVAETRQPETGMPIDITDVRSLILALGGSAPISQYTGTPASTVKSWPHRDNIPTDHWQDLIDMAASLGMEGVDAAFLLALVQRGK